MPGFKRLFSGFTAAFTKKPEAPKADGKEVFSVRRNGGRIYPFYSASSILSEYAELADAVRSESELGAEVWNEHAQPLIERFVRIAGALPASEAVHDPDASGLTRHTLLVARDAMESLRVTWDGKNIPAERAEALCLLLMALMHDLGKCLTDYVLRSESGEIWEPFKEDLEDFRVRTRSTHYELQFVPERSDSHGNLWPPVMTLLLSDDPSVLSYVYGKISLEEAMPECSSMWKLVTEADHLAAASALSRGGTHAKVSDLLRARLLEGIMSGAIPCNTRASGALVTEQGVLLEQGSEIYRRQFELAKELFPQTQEDTSAYHDYRRTNNRYSRRLLAASGFFKVRSAKRLASWHRVFCQDGLCWVYAVLVPLTVPDSIKRVGASDLGAEPPEIKRVLDIFGECDKPKRRLVFFNLKKGQTFRLDPLESSDADPVSMRYLKISGRRNNPDDLYKGDDHVDFVDLDLADDQDDTKGMDPIKLPDDLEQGNSERSFS